MKAEIPSDEELRLQALRRYDVLDSTAEQAYDDITLLAAHIAKTPIALISLIDRDRQWFKSKVGLAAVETPRELAFCAHAILTPDQPLMVEDATREGRFADNALVVGPPNIRFYFGVPLVTPDEFPLGTLCAIDHSPRTLCPDQIQALRALSRQVMKLLELRRTAAELRAATEKADAANRIKSMFLASMSHDIRTPIAGVLGTSELLLGTPLSTEQLECVENIRVSADSLLSLINDILDLSKVESGRLELDVRPLSLRSFLDEVTRTLAFASARKGLHLEARVHEAVPPAVLLDGPRLRQILVNLLGNAVKFTAAGRVVLEVFPRGDGPTTGLTFSIRDTGPGIPAARQAVIFEAFSQADRSVARIYGGTGLGLAIARRLVEAMGGKLQLESEEGRGSTFSFTIPAPAVAAPQGHSASAERARESRPLSILLAEDNVVIRKVVSSMLAKQGHSVTAVGDGREALDAFDQKSFDAILMDVEMPGMDGWEATAAIRQREILSGRHAPIVAITAHAMTGDQARCRAAGMDDYLPKPIHPAELAAVLIRVTSPE
ncbi:MAG TPA: ATP-binding protein [Bryobacteraceae bacterium]|nr:ATP-binding protein [Bryobacteraceae bacterium]